MQCTTLEVALPSPTNTTDFSVTCPLANVIQVNVRSNQVFLDCFMQGAVPPSAVRNFQYQAMGYSWDDETDRKNFYAFVPIASGTYVLLEKY